MVKLFVQKFTSIFSFCVLIIIVGLMAYFSLPKESTPEIKQPYIFVTTTYPGVATKDIENLITRPIEEEIDGLEGLDEITSSSAQSVSFIFAKFTSDVTVETALRRVKERVDQAKPSLPDDANDPVVQEFSSSNWPIYIILMSHPDGLHLLDKAADLVQDELKRIPGVLDVKVAGKLEHEVAVELDPRKLEHYGFSISTVINAIRGENMSIPGGVLKTGAKNYTLSVTGEILNPGDFEKIMVSSGGKRVPLRDLGSARFSGADPTTISRLNGKPAIAFSLTKRTGENIIEIVKNAEERLDKLRPDLPSGTNIVCSYDEADTIGDIVADLENNILTAFILVMGVTIFFLGFRNSIFVSLAIPFSMLMSFFILQIIGITLNMVVLFSLVLALGMLVDNGIVIVENIFRHASMGKSRVKAAIEGSQEVAAPIFASTLTTVLAFFPIVFMPGVMGDFMSYLPKTVIVVLTCSLLVAIVINPVFCARFLNISEESRKKITEGSGLFVRFQSWYGHRVEWAIRHWGIVLFSIFFIVITGFVLYGKFGKDTLFFPHLDPNTGVVDIEMPPGTPLAVTDSVVRKIEKIVPRSPASLKLYQSTTGRGEGGDMFGGLGDEFNRANIRVEYLPYLEREIRGSVAVDSLRNRLSDFTGAKLTVKELENGPPTGTDVSYEISGKEYRVMGMIADSILHILHQYPQLKLVSSDYEAAKPEYQISIDRQKASFYGLSTSQIAGEIRNAIHGGIAGTFRQEKEEYDIVVRHLTPYRNSLEDLRNLQIVNRDDERISLGMVADIQEGTATGVIKRRNLNRAVQVYGNFRKDIAGSAEIKKEIEEKVAALTIPPGYHVGPGSGFELRNEAIQYLTQAFLIAVFLIFIVLITQFNSITQPVIIIVTSLLSIGGIVWGYFLSGQNFVIIMSGIGSIALIGVVVNNCIVLIDYTNLLIKGCMPWDQAIITAGKTRLRPVLLTAITTILGLLPMGLGISFDFHSFSLQIGSESGEYFRPFAWAMVYGLTFATVITLFIVPVLLTLNFKLFPPHREEE